MESHYTLCLDYQLAQKGSMTSKEQLSYNFKVTLKVWNTSFVGQGLFSWIDSRCKQAISKANILFGGKSVLLFGDIAQLPPVGDKVFNI